MPCSHKEAARVDSCQKIRGKRKAESVVPASWIWTLRVIISHALGLPQLLAESCQQSGERKEGRRFRFQLCQQHAPPKHYIRVFILWQQGTLVHSNSGCDLSIVHVHLCRSREGSPPSNTCKTHILSTCPVWGFSVQRNVDKLE